MTYLSILSCLFLMGCSTYSEGFDCPKGEGMACRSMSQINAAITKKEVPHMMDEEEELDKIYIFYPPNERRFAKFVTLDKEKS